MLESTPPHSWVVVAAQRLASAARRGGAEDESAAIPRLVGHPSIHKTRQELVVARTCWAVIAPLFIVISRDPHLQFFPQKQ